MRYPTPRPWLAALLAATLLSACSAPESTGPAPLAIDEGSSCALDGMLLANFPGPKAQIHYEGADPDFFCDTVELFAVLKNQEQARKVSAVYVQDMGATDWDEPKDHWIDARTAFYVHGSKKHGSMGPTIASFAREADASRFAADHGGKLLRFDQVTPEMVVLDGGVLSDRKM